MEDKWNEIEIWFNNSQMGISEKRNKNPTNLISYAEKSILPPRLLVKMFILVTFIENNMEVSFTTKNPCML